MSKTVLSKRMSLQAFENGYWYATDLVAFGKKLGLPAAHRTRKNELENAIKAYLATGRLPKTTPSKLKNMNVPKTYKSWRAFARNKRVGRTI
jgi:hypothetical protein